MNRLYRLVVPRRETGGFLTPGFQGFSSFMVKLYYMQTVDVFFNRYIEENEAEYVCDNLPIRYGWRGLDGFPIQNYYQYSQGSGNEIPQPKVSQL